MTFMVEILLISLLIPLNFIAWLAFLGLIIKMSRI